jgi:hypothetical protein
VTVHQHSPEAAQRRASSGVGRAVNGLESSAFFSRCFLSWKNDDGMMGSRCNAPLTDTVGKRRPGAVRCGLNVDVQWLGVAEDRRLRVSDQRKLTGFGAVKRACAQGAHPLLKQFSVSMLNFRKTPYFSNQHELRTCFVLDRLW